MAGIWKRKDRDAWVVDYTDATGRRHRLVAPTRERAEDLLAEKIKESRQAAPVCDDPDITVAEYAARWHDAVALEVSPRTLASYRQITTLYILPTLGELKLRGLHRGHIRALLIQKAKEPSPKTKTGLKKNTLRLIRACLSAMLGAALEDGLLISNPALQVVRRRKKHVHSITALERRKSIRAMSAEQLAAFLGAAESAPVVYGALFATMARTGLRPGEAIALQPDDLDFQSYKIHVTRALSHGLVGSTKTGESRLVDMSRQLASLLRAFLVWREKQQLRHSWAEIPPWLFFNERGQPLEESRTRKCFHRVLKNAGLSGFKGPYDLRHTFATLLLARNAPITYVSAQLGHTKPTTTLQWYSHWIPSDDSHRFVDGLDGAAGNLWHQFGTKTTQRTQRRPQVFEKKRAGARSRTADLLITNQLLYRLSYASAAGGSTESCCGSPCPSAAESALGRCGPRASRDRRTSKYGFHDHFEHTPSSSVSSTKSSPPASLEPPTRSATATPSHATTGPLSATRSSTSTTGTHSNSSASSASTRWSYPGFVDRCFATLECELLDRHRLKNQVEAREWSSSSTNATARSSATTTRPSRTSSRTPNCSASPARLSPSTM